MARKGIVVDTHPEDNSVDLVMLDDGARLVGVKVMAFGASTRTGTIDLPEIPEKKDKWDITKPTGQEVEAVVGCIGRQPYVAGFFFPPKNQMLWKDKKRRVFRHQSDVSQFIDGDGNFQMDWPNGTFFRVGETPSREDTAGKNFAGNAAVDRNTGKRYYARIGLAGGKGTITVSPDGLVSFELEDDYLVKSKGNVSMEADGNISLKAKGALQLESQGDATMTSSGGFKMKATNNVEINGAQVRLNDPAPPPPE